MSHFAVYLHPETCLTSKPIEQIRFIGHSLLHFAQVREELAQHLADYPQLSLRRADLAEFQRVHTPDYLAALQRMAAGEPVSVFIAISLPSSVMRTVTPMPPNSPSRSWPNICRCAGVRKVVCESPSA